MGVSKGRSITRESGLYHWSNRRDTEIGCRDSLGRRLADDWGGPAQKVWIKTCLLVAREIIGNRPRGDRARGWLVTQTDIGLGP